MPNTTPKVFTTELVVAAYEHNCPRCGWYNLLNSVPRWTDEGKVIELTYDRDHLSHMHKDPEEKMNVQRVAPYSGNFTVCPHCSATIEITDWNDAYD
jgi:hypothetical protein